MLDCARIHVHNRVIAAKTTTTTAEDATRRRSSRTRASHAALEMLPGLSATARHQLACRGKTSKINWLMTPTKYSIIK